MLEDRSFEFTVEERNAVLLPQSTKEEESGITGYRYCERNLKKAGLLHEDRNYKSKIGRNECGITTGRKELGIYRGKKELGINTKKQRESTEE